jgi:plasmid stabilization system protein ParE
VTLDWSEHPEARAEYLKALAWYASVGNGTVGEDFADAADAASELILQFPHGAPPYEDNLADPEIRHLHIGKFPYLLIFSVREDEVLVLAYAHERRRPGYWMHRVTE